MKFSLGTIAVLAAFATATPARAEQYNAEQESFALSDLQWIASVDGSYSLSGADATTYGRSTSVYGGEPVIDMAGGAGLILGIGFESSNGWRLQGKFGYLTLKSDEATVFGHGERVDDEFSLDAEIESFVFMLSGTYDFDLGASRFTPFFTAGVGVSRNETKSVLLDSTYNSIIWNGTVFDDQSISDQAFPEGYTTEFAWNMQFGLRMDISPKVGLSLAYGLIDLGETTTETNDNGDAIGFNDLMSEQITLGFDYRF